MATSRARRRPLRLSNKPKRPSPQSPPMRPPPPSARSRCAANPAGRKINALAMSPRAARSSTATAHSLQALTLLTHRLTTRILSSLSMVIKKTAGRRSGGLWWIARSKPRRSLRASIQRLRQSPWPELRPPQRAAPSR